MTSIILSTLIHAPIQACFDLSRDIDMHQKGMEKTKERVVEGKTSGYCELGDEITWEAIHFGMKQQLRIKITQMKAPYYFEDIMVKGAFKSMNHQHDFRSLDDRTTVMTDYFHYETPGWIFGKLFDWLFLKKYMIQLLLERNQFIKQTAEKD